MPSKVEIVEMPQALALGEHTLNKHEVQKHQWRKWNNQARYIFNALINQMQDQYPITHPGMSAMPITHWHTICWNAAWLAADATMETVKGHKPKKDLTDVSEKVLLQKLYTKAGIAIPKEIDPTKEANRIERALRAK